MRRRKPRARRSERTKTSRTPHPEAVDCRAAKTSGLFLFKFQVDDDLFLVIEARDRSRGGFGAIFFGVDFIVDIRVEAAEAVIAFLVGDVAADCIGARISEKNDGRRYGGLRGLVQHNAADGA